MSFSGASCSVVVLMLVSEPSLSRTLMFATLSVVSVFFMVCLILQCSRSMICAWSDDLTLGQCARSLQQPPKIYLGMGGKKDFFRVAEPAVVQMFECAKGLGDVLVLHGHDLT